jgi:predicted nucleic acid-binding protein
LKYLPAIGSPLTCPAKYLWGRQYLPLPRQQTKGLYPEAIPELRKNEPLTQTASPFPGILEFSLLTHLVMVWLTNEIFGTSGMTESRFVLDTNAVIFLITKGNVIPSSFENDLDEADLFISVITEIELFAKPELPPSEEEGLRVFLSDRISIINLTNEIKNEAIAIRRFTRRKIPDSIVAATSIMINAVLLTNDHHLLNLSWPGLRTQNIF